MKSVGPRKIQNAIESKDLATISPGFALSGRWDGHYTQHDATRKISAEFTHCGPKLLGFMNDSCTIIEGSVGDLVVQQRMPPGSDERIVARIRSMCPGLEKFPVRTLVELPPLSTIAGRVERTRVEFVKTYRGEHFAGYQVGDRRIGLRGIDQEIVYQGVLNAFGTEIHGRWRVASIRKAGSFSHRSVGTFVLRRVIPPCPANPFAAREN
jgi:hypothetical protein